MEEKKESQERKEKKRKKERKHREVLNMVVYLRSLLGL
jgi:hypothetical protein